MKKSYKVDTFYDNEIGSFKLIKEIDLYEAVINWRNKKSFLHLELGSKDEMKESILVAKLMIKEQDIWDNSMKDFAAKELLDLANDWQPQELYEANGKISEEQFISKITLESLQVYPSGEFEAFYNDNELFFGHIIVIKGDIDGLFESADIQG